MKTPEHDSDPEFTELINEIASERPEPRAEWAEEMDARVRDGFGRRDSWSFAGIRARLHRPSGSRPVAIVGVVASMMLAGVLAVELIDGGADDGAPTSSAVVAEESTGGSASGDRSAGGAAGGAPALKDANRNLKQFKRGKREAGYSIIGLNGENRGIPGDPAVLAPGGAYDGFQANARQANRKQDRNARLELRTSPREVREVSDRAISLIEDIGGVVLNSSLKEGEKGATAQLQLRVPSAELDATLDRLTDLATVASLQETADDITAPFVSTKDKLADARAERQALLKALGNASDADEADKLRRQAKKARQRISRRQAQFQRVAQRARNSQISLEIGGRKADQASDEGSGSRWSLGNLIDDAATVLRATLGILLVIAAALIPLGLIALPARLLYTRHRKHQRENALSAS